MGITTTPLTFLGGMSRDFLTTARSGIPYVEFLKVSEAWQLGNANATRYLACRWEDAKQFRTDFLGQSVYEPGASAGGVTSNLRRYPPEQHPTYDFLYANSMSLLDPMGVPTTVRDDLAKCMSSNPDYGYMSQRDQTTNAVRFNIAAYSVIYTKPDFDVYDNENTPNNVTPALGELGRYLIRNFDPGAENQSIPGNLLYFVNGPPWVPLAEPPPVTQPTLLMEYIWTQVPLIPIAAIQQAIGKVNAGPNLFDGYYQPGTLLCLPPKLKREPTAIGDVAFTISYQFQMRENPDVNGTPGGHNFLFRKSSAAYEEVQMAQSGSTGDNGPTFYSPPRRIFQDFDFNQLFVLPATAPPVGGGNDNNNVPF